MISSFSEIENLIVICYWFDEMNSSWICRICWAYIRPTKLIQRHARRTQYPSNACASIQNWKFSLSATQRTKVVHFNVIHRTPIAFFRRYTVRVPSHCVGSISASTPVRLPHYGVSRLEAWLQLSFLQHYTSRAHTYTRARTLIHTGHFSKLNNIINCYIIYPISSEVKFRFCSLLAYIISLSSIWMWIEWAMPTNLIGICFSALYIFILYILFWCVRYVCAFAWLGTVPV